MLKLRLFKILLVFLVLCVHITQAFAVELAIDLSKIKPLSEVEFLEEEAFENQTKLIDETPYDDQFLSYQVRLPKDWMENSTNLNAVNTLDDSGAPQNVLGIVSSYISPAKNYQRSFFTVEAVELTHEISARSWFIHYILKSGLSLEQVGLEDGEQAEAVYIEVQGDITYVVRVKSIINGPRMVLARYYVPVELYKDEKVQQAQIINSFELTNRQDVNIEPLEIHGFLDQTYFSYPASWTLNAPSVRSIDRMEAQLFHRKENGTMAGQINMFLINKDLKTSRSQEIKYYKDQFNLPDYAIDSLIETVETQHLPEVIFSKTQAYLMKATRTRLLDYELWLSVLENEKYIYIMALFTPARNDDFYTWARNTESFKLILSNIRLEDESVDKFQFLNR